MQGMTKRPCLDCPEYAAPGRSRCQRCHAAHEAKRRADPTLSGRRGSTAAWKSLRKLVLRRDKFSCRECGRHEQVLEPSEQLEVHHVDGDASNDRIDNLVTVCSSCHRSTHARAA